MRFEGQFKYRDESNVNASSAQPAAKSRELMFHARFRSFAEIGLPCHLAKQ
jgi:hypothetical protein